MSDNKIPFSFDKYLSGGYLVVTRDGREVKDVEFKEGKQYPIRGTTPTKGAWLKDGHCLIGKAEDTGDLFLIPISKEGDKEEKKWTEIIKVIEGLELDSAFSSHYQLGANMMRNKIIKYLTSITNDK